MTTQEVVPDSEERVFIDYLNQSRGIWVSQENYQKWNDGEFRIITPEMVLGYTVEGNSYEGAPDIHISIAEHGGKDLEVNCYYLVPEQVSPPKECVHSYDCHKLSDLESEIKPEWVTIDHSGRFIRPTKEQLEEKLEEAREFARQGQGRLPYLLPKKELTIARNWAEVLGEEIPIEEEAYMYNNHRDAWAKRMQPQISEVLDEFEEQVFDFGFYTEMHFDEMENIQIIVNAITKGVLNPPEDQETRERLYEITSLDLKRLKNEEEDWREKMNTIRRRHHQHKKWADSEQAKLDDLASRLDIEQSKAEKLQEIGKMRFTPVSTESHRHEMDALEFFN